MMSEAVFDAGYRIFRFAFRELHRGRRFVEGTESVDARNLQQFLGVGLFARDARNLRDSWKCEKGSFEVTSDFSDTLDLKYTE